MWISVGIFIGVIYAVYLFYMKTVKGVCCSKADLTDKTVIVTGSDKGIGYYTALDLARRNARVILACRNTETARSAAEQINKSTGNQNVTVRKLDLSNLKSVRQFVDEFLRDEKRLDILVNNAGAAGLPFVRTEDGLEIMFATNYLGPFLLTMLLLDTMKRSAQSRIVNVSSVMHRFTRGPLDVDNINSEKSYVPSLIYNVTKLEQVLFTRELGRRLEGSGVVVNAVHPGSVQSNLMDKLPQPAKFAMKTISRLFFRTTEEGAQSSLYAAVSEELNGVSGQYISECCIEKPSRNARDDATAKKLFQRSLSLAGLADPLT